MPKILCLFLLFFLTGQRNAEVFQVWGQIIKVSEQQAFHGHRYFIYYTKDKKEYAYPIAIKTIAQEKMIKGHVRKLAKISGSIHSLKIDNDGASVTFVYFSPRSISPLSLSQLSSDRPKSIQEKKPRLLSAENYTEGGISIPDDAANYAVFTAGALLIGSILSDYLQKK
ncbi:MAG: hypothetical protein A2X86_14580 [Bdellovibrionales bacterium GWA2_49_15]|nr:MAG: hypothetical protein A2X86_14580 [Bdellovibrionales bacterium GWA2_49_15]HAZ13434.1 hypothetical protein [Bdellovibrionales bacterium]